MAMPVPVIGMKTETTKHDGPAPGLRRVLPVLIANSKEKERAALDHPLDPGVYLYSRYSKLVIVLWSVCALGPSRCLSHDYSITQGTVPTASPDHLAPFTAARGRRRSPGLRPLLCPCGVFQLATLGKKHKGYV